MSVNVRRSFADFMNQQLDPMVDAFLKELSNVSEDQKSLTQSVCSRLLHEVSLLPAFRVPNEQFSVQEEQLLLFKTVKVFVETLVSLARLPGEHNENIREGIAHFVEVISISPLEELVTSTELLPEWVDEILSCQKLVKPFLSPISFEQEGSRALTYKIKKEEKTRGYLFATMHHLITPELRECAKLSGGVFKRLVKCAVFCTEVSVRGNGCGHSVEDSLMQVAKKQGIANFGIDAPEREANAGESEMTEKEAEQHLALCAESYRSGNIEQMKSLRLTPLKPEIGKKRDARMAQNIDTFLNIAVSVGQKRNEVPHRSFFAIGADHLLHEGPESILSLLAEKGWTLKFKKNTL